MRKHRNDEATYTEIVFRCTVQENYVLCRWSILIPACMCPVDLPQAVHTQQSTTDLVKFNG